MFPSKLANAACIPGLIVLQVNKNLILQASGAESLFGQKNESQRVCFISSLVCRHSERSLNSGLHKNVGVKDSIMNKEVPDYHGCQHKGIGFVTWLNQLGRTD